MVTVLVGWGCYAASPAYAQAPHPFFKHTHSGVHGDKAKFLNLILRGEFRSPETTVSVFNQNFGPRLGFTATSTEDLVEHLRSPEFVMVPCEGGVRNYGLTDGGFATLVDRSCYTGEYLLVHQPTGLRVFSDDCGNPQFVPPAPPVVERRRELPQGPVKTYVTDHCGWFNHGCSNVGHLEDIDMLPAIGHPRPPKAQPAPQNEGGQQ